MYAPYVTAEKHRQAAHEAADIIERSLQKCKKYLITREDDWAMTRALAVLRQVPAPAAGK